MQTASSIPTDDAFRALLAERPVLIDARKILDGGIGVYTQNLVADLRARNIPVALLGDADSCNRFSWASSVRILKETAQPYSADELFSLARRVPFREFSLFHVPHYTLPFHVPIPTVVTVHDMIHLTHPERFWYPPVAWAMIASALLRADRVVTVSRAAKADIERYFPRMLRRSGDITVVPNRLADAFRADTVVSPVGGERYLFLSVSQPKPHKGVLDLLQAFCAAKDQLESLVARGQVPRAALSTELCIAGYGSSALSELTEYRALLDNRSDIRIVGALEVAELRRYYAGALMAVVPSRAEGFGFPVIEAHSQGTAVIARPIAALREILQERDLIADDLSIESLTAVLIRAMSSERASEPSAELRAHARSFSPERSILPILELYRAVVSTA